MLQELFGVERFKGKSTAYDGSVSDSVGFALQAALRALADQYPRFQEMTWGTIDFSAGAYSPKKLDTTRKIAFWLHYIQRGEEVVVEADVTIRRRDGVWVAASGSLAVKHPQLYLPFSYEVDPGEGLVAVERTMAAVR